MKFKLSIAIASSIDDCFSPKSYSNIGYDGFSTISKRTEFNSDSVMEIELTLFEIFDSETLRALYPHRLTRIFWKKTNLNTCPLLIWNVHVIIMTRNNKRNEGNLCKCFDMKNESNDEQTIWDVYLKCRHRGKILRGIIYAGMWKQDLFFLNGKNKNFRFYLPFGWSVSSYEQLGN